MVLPAFALVLMGGTVGCVVLGFGFLDALYQTLTTVTTVGFCEVHPLTPAGQVSRSCRSWSVSAPRSTRWAWCWKR